MFFFIFVGLWLQFWHLSNSPACGLDWVLLMTCLSAAGRVLWAQHSHQHSPATVPPGSGFRDGTSIILQSLKLHGIRRHFNQ